MIVGNLNEPETYQKLSAHPIWKKAFSFLKNEIANKKDGEYEIMNRDVYVSISTLSPQPADKCAFEAHNQYLDIHYCIEGGEIIGYAPTNTLIPSMDFDTTKDYCLYESPQNYQKITLTPGLFVIFFPEDAHIPKIFDGINTDLKKAVVKIKMEKIK